MIADLAITSLETISAFDISTGAYKYTLDELQNASLNQTQDAQEITGKGGRKIDSLDRNKAVTVSGANGLVSGGLLETQTGGKFTHGATKVMWTDYVTASANDTAATTYVAVGDTGKEIVALYKKNADGTLGTEFTQDSTASAAGKFAYVPGTKVLTFFASGDTHDVAKGDELVVIYERNITADKLVNESDKYSEKCSLYIDALAEDKCGNVFRVQFYIPKAKFSGEFSFEMGDNQTVHNFEAESLAGGCTGGGSLWTYTVFGATTADTPVS